MKGVQETLRCGTFYQVKRSIFRCVVQGDFNCSHVGNRYSIANLLLTFNLKYQRTNSPILFPYFSYKSSGEKLFKNQENLPLSDHILNSHDFGLNMH